MRMVLLKDCGAGKAGETVTHPGAFRLAFPVKHCVARPGDLEAVRAIEQEIETVRGSSKERLLLAMTAAGTWPVNLEAETSVGESATESEDGPGDAAAESDASPAETGSKRRSRG